MLNVVHPWLEIECMEMYLKWKLTLFPMGVVVEMCLLIEKIVFLPEHPPFPKTGELLPKHDFCEYMFFLFFFGVFQILYPIYRRLNDQVYKHGKMAYNIFFLFLNSAICDFLGFLTLSRETKGLFR